MEIFVVIIPIVTFMAGYLLSVLERKRKEKQKLDNLRMILFRELGENFRWVNQTIPVESQDEQRQQLPDPFALALYGRQLSYDVFNAYLDRMDGLKPKELEAVFEAYLAMRRISLVAEDYFEGRQQGADDLAGRATLLFVSMKTGHGLLIEALQLFKGGSELLEELAAQQGVILQHQQMARSTVIRHDLTAPPG